MIDLISIHIPKTGGTSFYQILQEVYGSALSPSFRRRDLPGGSDIRTLIEPEVRVLHGHFRYPEIQQIHQQDGSKLIAWLRDPAERVYSNYRFFIAGLQDPERNPEQYERNKHRLHETLEVYASLPENRDRISEFLGGVKPEKFFFLGLLETFNTDLQRLGRMLDWPELRVPKLNRQSPQNLSDADRELLLSLNQEDVNLYQRVLDLRQNQIG